MEMANQIGYYIITAFVSFVLTCLGWILFKKKDNEKKEHDPCQSILVLQQDFKNHKEVYEKNIDLHERRLNAHAKELDILRETIVRQEQNSSHLSEKIDEIKTEIKKVTEFLYSGIWKKNE